MWPGWFGKVVKAGKFGFVPICYIKITACKHPGISHNQLGKYE